MMMKIFGAALIVSGGYLLGKVRTIQWNKRLRALREVEQLFKEYDSELRQYRRSVGESFSGKGGMAAAILEGETIKELTKEDQQKLNTVVAQLKSNGSFQESVAVSGEFLHHLEGTISKLQEDTASQGKALPLLTGAIGLLIAVLLY